MRFDTTFRLSATQGEIASTQSRAISHAYEMSACFFGIALLLAAAFKAESTYTGDRSLSINLPPVFLGTEIAFEWVLAFFLLSGLLKQWTRFAAIVLLFIFITVSGWHLLSGRQSCGCFGRLAFSPGWIFAFDLVVLIAISILGRDHRRGLSNARRRPSSVRVSLATATAIIVPVLTLVSLQAPNTSGDIILLDQRFVPGTQFPLLKFMSDADQISISKSEQIVIVFRHDCEQCRDYINSIATKVSPKERGSITLIDLSKGVPVDFGFKQITLSRGVDFAAQVPVKLHLNRGVIVSVEHPDP